MIKKVPNRIDIHVGSRVRLRRMLLGMTQQKLGDMLELTFQQIQKYEKGTNRISASRLYEISKILSVPVQFFFDDIVTEIESIEPGTTQRNSASFGMDFVSSNEGLKLNSAYVNITDSNIRKSLLNLVKALTRDQDESNPGEGQQ